MYSKETQNKIEKLRKRLRQSFTYKDSFPSVLISRLVYKFV